MSEQVTTNLYPIGRPSPDGHCSHGWLVVTLDAAGNPLPDMPPVLALPMPLQGGQDYHLVIEAQAENLTLKQGQNTLASIDCTDKQQDVLAILAEGRIGLVQVEDGFELAEDTRLKIDHKAVIDMQPFYDDHQHRLAVMQKHEPELHEQQRRIFDAMPAYQQARKAAENRPAPVTISDDKKAEIWDSVMGRKKGE